MLRILLIPTKLIYQEKLFLHFTITGDDAGNPNYSLSTSIKHKGPLKT